MDISKYTDFFHDGKVIEISQDTNNICFFLKSALIEPAYVSDLSLLTNGGRLIGRLHLKDVQEVQFTDGTVQSFQSQGETNSILQLDLKKNILRFEMIWEFCEPISTGSIPMFCTIIAQDIHWENLPDYNDPDYPSIDHYTKYFVGGALKKIKMKDEIYLQIVMESAAIDTEGIVLGSYKLTERNTLVGTLQMLWVQRLFCNGKEMTVDSLSTRNASGAITKMSIANHLVTLNVLWKSSINEKNQEVIEERIEILAGAISWRDRLE